MDKEDAVHIYNGILLSHKKEWNNAICSNMDGPGDDPETDSQISENKHGYQRGNMAGRDKLGAWDLHTHTTTYKIDNQQGPII